MATTLLYDNLSLLGFFPGNIDQITSIKYCLKNLPRLLQMLRFQHRLYLFLFDKLDSKKAAKDFKHLQELLDKSSELEFKKLLKQWLLNLREAAGLPRLMPRFFVSPRLADLLELFLCLSLHALLLEQQRLFGLSPDDAILSPSAGRPDPLGLRLLETEAADLCRQAALAAAARTRLADSSRRLGRGLAQRLRALAVESAELQRETDALREAAREAAVAAGSPLPGRSAPSESDEHCRHRAARLARCQPALTAADAAAADALAPGRPILDAGQVRLDRRLPPLALPVSLPDCLAKRLAAVSSHGRGAGVDADDDFADAPLSAGRVRLTGLLRAVTAGVLPALAEPWSARKPPSQDPAALSSAVDPPPDRRLSALAAALRACEREAAALAMDTSEHWLPELALLADRHRLVWADADAAAAAAAAQAAESPAGKSEVSAPAKVSPPAANPAAPILTSPLHGNTPLRRGSVNFTPSPAVPGSAARVRFLDSDPLSPESSGSRVQPPDGSGRILANQEDELDSSTAMEIEQLMASCDQFARTVRFDLLDSSG